jgi:hypothetical protein
MTIISHNQEILSHESTDIFPITIKHLFGTVRQTIFKTTSVQHNQT